MVRKLESLFAFEDLSDNFCRLPGSDIWTGENQVERQVEVAQRLGDALHFLAAFGSKRALAVIGITARTAFHRDTVAQNVNFLHKLLACFALSRLSRVSGVS